ncbi:hypothetical protein [Paenibacillus wynnii]|uniref:hypothetical protein n=1 Tax=Paenibacillus wynnii TaxID=268407 RepID=UPI002792F97B|nr:hypothetical protein [Paenibacillus wynnii]MDQ0192625.1 hypothetical protein [Paenibacillus wynnii]
MNKTAVVTPTYGETCSDRESNEPKIQFSEPGAVEAWQDNVHEQGTRECVEGSEKWIS